MIRAAMGQRQFSHGIHIVLGNGAAAFQRRVGAGRAQHDQIGPHAVHPRSQRQLGRMVQNRV